MNILTKYFYVAVIAAGMLMPLGVAWYKIQHDDAPPERAYSESVACSSTYIMTTYHSAHEALDAIRNGTLACDVNNIDGPAGDMMRHILEGN